MNSIIQLTKIILAKSFLKEIKSAVCWQIDFSDH